MIRIGVIGAESTGKSTLCKQLSERYGYHWIKEYAREYVENLNRPYTYDDVLHIAQQQITELQAHYEEPVVLYDTELIITKVWMQYKFSKVAPEVELAIREHPMDGYLILAPDIAAEYDSVRENLDKREYLHNWYIEEVRQTKQPYCIISGQGEMRFQAAAEAIISMMK
ncbi:MAG: ATP-binding protein [Paludibacteraceae bacterium]|nr:ATP-binding protein [Paludibacteraceae bacterium]